ncbi:MAG: DUF4942 domain-containing protein [Leptospirales bacterium]|jgi:hypothetical protein
MEPASRPEEQPAEMVGVRSVEHLVGQRDLALRYYREAFELLEKAKEAVEEVRDVWIPISISDRSFYDVDDAVEIARKRIDGSLWSQLLREYGYDRYMDADSVREFERQAADDPQEVTINSVHTTLAELRDRSPQLFRRGIVNVFRRLDNRYVSNKSYALNRRIILGGVVKGPGLIPGLDYHARRRLMDLDRIMHMVDGRKQPTDERQQLDRLLTARLKQGKTTAQTNYYKIRMFQNGNMHITLLRDDLIDRINQILAEEYGAVLADDSRAGEGIHAKATIRKPSVGGGQQ